MVPEPRYIGIVYLLGVIPLHGKNKALGLGSHSYPLGAYREAYWGYKRWVRACIELGFFKLRVFDISGLNRVEKEL